MTARTLAGAVVLALLATACTKDFYVIGALCSAVQGCEATAGASGGGGNAGASGASSVGGSGGSGGLGEAGATEPGSLSVDLTGSGVERLPLELLGAAPTHFLIADDATPTSWNARVGTGFEVLSGAALELQQPAPFADPGRVLSHASAATFTTDSQWASSGDGALALEAVFRGEAGAVLLSQRDAEAGLELFLDSNGRLNLLLDAGAQVLGVASPPLVADAWHHCLALLDAGQGSAQLFCNGQAGATASVASGFAVPPVTAPATLGSAGPARLYWAELARWESPSFGPRGAWTDLARERFARLVGTYADGSREPLPFAEVRASGAYIDMTPSDAPDQRRLHPVGEHWPRIVCRPTSDEPRTCGLLVEASSSRTVAPEDFTLDQWDATEVTLLAGSAAGPTGAPSLFAATPSLASAAHTLEFSAPFGDGPAVMSFFARAGSSRFVSAEVEGAASATFDLVGLSVTANTDAHVASVEPWGDGLVRASFSFDVEPGIQRMRLSLLADDGEPVFAGDGSAFAELGDVELRFRSFSAPLPTFGTIQQADQLVYPTGNGNLPAGPWFSFSAELWLPEAPLVADAAVFNANFATGYDQQINLFVRPADGTLQFWGLGGDSNDWVLGDPRSLTDGKLHSIGAGVGPEGATVGVDGSAATTPGAYDTTLLDRVEIGTSTSSSGPLTGIVRRIRFAPPE